MKKLVLGVMVAATAMMAAGTASAGVTIDVQDFKPYVGVDYKYLNGLDQVEFDGYGGMKGVADKHTNVLGVTAGVQFNDYVGVEASYGKAVNKLKSAKVGYVDSYIDESGAETLYGEYLETSKLDFEHITVGLTGQYPIADKVYAKGLLGAAWQRFDASSVSNVTFDGEVGVKNTVPLAVTSNNDAVFLGKVGLGYQASQHSLFEINYTREGELDGVGLQYKYVF